MPRRNVNAIRRGKSKPHKQTCKCGPCRARRLRTNG